MSLDMKGEGTKLLFLLSYHKKTYVTVDSEISKIIMIHA